MKEAIMAYLIIGIILEIVFVFSIVAMVLTSPTISPTTIALLFIALGVPGIILIGQGYKRILLFAKVGRMIITQARETGHVDIGLVAQETGYPIEKTNAVLAMLKQRGVIPPDVG